MEIAKNRTAILCYKLTLAKEGTEISDIPEDNPAEFVFGAKQLLPAFESNLLGMREGDQFDFRVEAEDAYGPADSYAVFDVPKDTFEVDGKPDEKMLQIGNVIPMTDDQGNKHLGKVIKVIDDAVTLDFNHPLAGKDLRFTGKVVEVKDN